MQKTKRKSVDKPRKSDYNKNGGSTMDTIEKRRAYDAQMKKILSYKSVLANIMKYCTEEYKDMSIDDIVACIPGEVDVGNVPVDYDRSNNSLFVHSENSEDTTETEGCVMYDLKFCAKLPDSNGEIGLIINVEAQNDVNPGYPLVKRGIYYCGRLMSAQNKGSLRQSNYGNLKKVYSIWICPNAPDDKAESITSYSFTEKHIFGNYAEEHTNYDLMTVVLVFFNEKKTGGKKLFELLSSLIAGKSDDTEERKKFYESFGVKLSKTYKKEVDDMCNLSQGVYDKGVAAGIAEGMSKGKIEASEKIISNMLKKGIDTKTIASLTDFTVDQIKDVAKRTGIKI